MLRCRILTAARLVGEIAGLEFSSDAKLAIDAGAGLPEDQVELSESSSEVHFARRSVAEPCFTIPWIALSAPAYVPRKVAINPRDLAALLRVTENPCGPVAVRTFE
jgi:hypothetical protein